MAATPFAGAAFMRLCIFKLLQWRHSFLDAAVQTFLKASGVVPGAELGRRVLRYSVGGDGDEGLDDILANLCRVLYARYLDLVVLLISVEVLFVNCKVIADDQ
jgi:hypothetical protein